MSVPRYWRNEIPRYRLVGEECAQCGNKYFPARPVCSCGSTEFKAYSLAKKGEVVTWTVINNAPIGFEKYTPYMVALIELEDGLRLISHLGNGSGFSCNCIPGWFSITMPPTCGCTRLCSFWPMPA